MQTTTTLATLVLLSLSLLGCTTTTTTTTGTGYGQLTGLGAKAAPVTFNWTSADGGMSGLITAVLPDVSYQGQFFQITEQTRSEMLSPLWTHWSRGWNDWPYWAGPMAPPYPPQPMYPLYPTTQFITRYSGQVVATLAASGDPRMRCRFDLVVPMRGMAGGGDGECQLTDGRVVRATFSSK